MNYNFRTNGDIYEWTGYGDNLYVGRIDDDGDFRPASENFESHEEYVKSALRIELLVWASGNNPNWEPTSGHLSFAGVPDNGDEDWNFDTNSWNRNVATRIVESATDEEKSLAELERR